MTESSDRDVEVDVVVIYFAHIERLSLDASRSSQFGRAMMLLTHPNFGATVNYPMPRCTFDPHSGRPISRTVRFQSMCT
jgi:hypothetical protein